MYRKLLQILFIVIIILPENLFSQVPAKIIGPTLNFADNKLTINYDIANSNTTDRFYIWLEISSRSGTVIEPKSLSGDIGENIRGGAGKQIIWDLAKDNYKLNDEIFVQVKAEKMVKDFNKGQALLLSTAVPGLGQRVIYNHKPFWIMGIAAYGCLASSVAFNRTAYNAFEDYKTAEKPQKRDDLYDQVLKQDKVSQILAYTAGGIWLANIVWVAVTPNKYHRQSEERNISIGPTYNIYLKKAQISFCYRF